MDPFGGFSSDLCLRLSLAISDSRDLIRLSHASPALFCHRLQFRSSFHRHFFRNTLDDDLIQDALAIIHFPRLDHDPFIYDVEGRAIALVDAHLCKWGANAFDNPLAHDTRNTSRVKELKALFQGLWPFVHDYLSKATSQHLPLAYLELPPFSHHDLIDTPTQITLSLMSDDSSHFDLHLLTQEQQRRIIRAFLRYELLCKIYGPLGGNSRNTLVIQMYRTGNLFNGPVDASMNEFSGYRHDPRDPFRHWDWRVLYKYIKDSSHELDVQLLTCVREYISTVYGALIANQANTPIPQAQDLQKFENAPRQGMGGFPDYNPLYPAWTGFHWPAPEDVGWSDGPISLMASAGFVLLANVLALDGDHLCDFILHLKDNMRDRPPLVDATNVNLPLSAPSRLSRVSWYTNDFTRLYRQRARSLLRGTRQNLRLPTEDEYRNIYPSELEDPVFGWRGNLETRDELICHGKGILMYSSLRGMLVPFWIGQMPSM